MVLSTCNSTLSETHWNTDNIVGNFSLHTLGWLICGGCAIIATIISLFLIYKHAGHYTNPNEQRHIIRILLMVPVYAITSWLSYVWYWHAIYWEVARDCYEAFAIAAFFALLCSYIHPTLRGQKHFFAALVVKPWPWPCKKMTMPRSGLTWFNIIWIGIFQYVVIRVLCTIISTITQLMGVYCEDSLRPKYAHLWTMLSNIVAVTIAMYCLIAFYLNIKERLALNKPFFKLLCIKLVIFFSFWQMIILDLLSSTGVIKPTKYISPGDISVGFNSLLICFEMIIFAILHIFAFTWKEYDLGPDKVTPVAISLLNAFNPWDIVRALARGVRWLICGMSRRNRDAEKIRERLKIEEEAAGLVGNAASFGGRDSPPPQPSGPDALPMHPAPNDGRAEVSTLKVQTSGYGGYSPEPVEMHSSPQPGRKRPQAPPSPYSQQVASSGYGNAIAPPPTGQHQHHERYRDQTPSPVDRVGGRLAYPTVSHMPSVSVHQQQRPSDVRFLEQHQSLMGGSPGSPVEYLHSPSSPVVAGLHLPIPPIVGGHSVEEQRPYQAYSGSSSSGGHGQPGKGEHVDQA